MAIRLVFAALGVMTVLMAMSADSFMLMFFHTPSLLMVFGGYFVFRWMVYPHGVKFQRPSLQGAAAFFDLQRVVRGLSVVPLICGTLGALHSLDDPSRIGPMVAMSFLGMLYGLLLSEGVHGPKAQLHLARLTPVPPRAGSANVGRLFLSAVFWLVLVWAGLSASGQLSFFLDAPSLFYVGGLTCFISLAVHAPDHIWSAFVAATQPNLTQAPGNARHIVVLSTVRGAFAVAGASGMLIGVVKMLSHLADPSALGPALSVAGLTWFYGFVGAEVVMRTLVLRLKPEARCGVPIASGVFPLALSAVGVGLQFVLLSGVMLFWT